MKYIKRFKTFENSNNISTEEIISLIQKHIVEENYENEYTLDEGWHKFIDNQEMGDCQGIVSGIIMFAKNNAWSDRVKKHFGHITTDEPSIDEDGEENYEFTHHWVTIDDKIVEFSKGTLRDYIEWDNLYDIDPEDVDKYNSF
jgi:hypothetical protein